MPILVFGKLSQDARPRLVDKSNINCTGDDNGVIELNPEVAPACVKMADLFFLFNPFSLLGLVIGCKLSVHVDAIKQEYGPVCFVPRRTYTHPQGK